MLNPLKLIICGSSKITHYHIEAIKNIIDTHKAARDILPIENSEFRKYCKRRLLNYFLKYN